MYVFICKRVFRSSHFFLFEKKCAHISVTALKILDSETVSPGVSLGASRCKGKCFSVPATAECKKFKWIWLQQVGFECPHHLQMSLLNLHSLNKKVPFIHVGPCNLPKFWVKKVVTKNLFHVRLKIVPGKLFYVWWICLVNMLQSPGREVQFRVAHLKYFICHDCPIKQNSDRLKVDRGNWTYNQDDKRGNSLQQKQMSLIKIVEPFVPQTKNVQLLQNSQTTPDLREVNSLLPLHLHLITYYTTYNNNTVTQDNSIISPPLIPWVISA